MLVTESIIGIQNNQASLSVDLVGGALTDFHLHNNVNPLNFKLSPQNMPDINRSGACYQGHFLCLGHWGPPSGGEKQAGLPHHGQAASLLWVEQSSDHINEILMQVEMPLEGLHLARSINLDAHNAVFKVNEQVTNTNPLGRLYNMVQHPTIAGPFLTANTIVNCNADNGFNYLQSSKPLEHAAKWPGGIMEDAGKMNISKPDKACSSVFCFTIEKDAALGWITAYSPENDLLIGYLWNRKDYPWINLWQDFDGDNIRYRGLEFGTTGMHKPFKQILHEGNHQVFGEYTYKYIDAGETQSRNYLAFLCQTPAGYTGTANVAVRDGNILITAIGTSRQITIKTTLSDGF